MNIKSSVAWSITWKSDRQESPGRKIEISIGTGSKISNSYYSNFQHF